MKELLTTGDPVLLSIIRHELSEEGIAFHIFDSFVGSLFPGDLGVASSRVMVEEDDFSRARYVLNLIQSEGEQA